MIRNENYRNKGYIIETINNYIERKTKKELLVMTLKMAADELGMSINTFKKYLDEEIIDGKIKTKIKLIKEEK